MRCSSAFNSRILHGTAYPILLAAQRGCHCIRSRTVRLIFGAVAEDDAPIRADDHVAAELAGIFVVLEAEFAPAPDKVVILLEDFGRVNLAQGTDAHPVRFVDCAPLVREQRHVVRDVEVCAVLREPLHLAEEERDDADAHPGEFAGLPQLRQVFLAGESLQVAVEHQDQRPAEMVGKPPFVAAIRVQREIGCG